MFDAVLFDCDGVLVDSEPITNGVLREMLNEAGWALDQALDHEVVDLPVDQLAHRLLLMAGVAEAKLEQHDRLLAEGIGRLVGEDIAADPGDDLLFAQQFLHRQSLQQVAVGLRFGDEMLLQCAAPEVPEEEVELCLQQRGGVGTHGWLRQCHGVSSAT